MRFLFHRSEKTRFAGAALLALVVLGPAGWAEAPMPKAPASAQLTNDAGGERTAELPPHEPRGSFASLRELANASSVVIVGTTGRYGRVRRMPDGHGSQVLFTTKVDQVLKGDILPSVSVTVMESGKHLEVPVGVMAKAHSEDVTALRLFANTTYLMFLTALADGMGYVPTGGPQGLYWLRPDGTIQPADLRSPGLLSGLPHSRGAFLAEAQSAVGGTRVADGGATLEAAALVGSPEVTMPNPELEDVAPAAHSVRPLPVPGRIEAEDFDERSRPPAPEGKQAAGLDVLAVPPRGHALVTKRRDDWFQYRVAVARTGSYLVEARVAAMGCGGQVHLEVDGADATGPLPIPNTSSRGRSFELIRKNGVTLAAGDHALRLVVDAVPPGAPSAATIDFVQIMPALQSLAPSSPLAAAASPAREPAHPRLLLTPTRTREIQRAVTVRGSHHELLFQRMKRRIEQGASAYEVVGGVDDAASMQHAALAQEAALLYVLSGRRADAARAFEALQAALDVSAAPSLFPRRPEHRSDLSRRSRVGLAAALAYDWCFSGWSEAQRVFARDKLRQMLDTWPCVGDAELEPPYLGPRGVELRGAEVVVLLALGEEAPRSSRYGQLKSWLVQHLSAAYSEDGTSRSGTDVSYASGRYLFPAVYACRSVGDHSLDAAFESKAWWRLMYLGSLEGPPMPLGAYTAGRLFRSGWASLIFPSVPRDRLGHYLWFFDRHVGRAGVQLDDADGGAVWGLLYYPESALAVEPSAMPTAFHDRGAGRFVVRDGWSSSRVLAALTTDPPRQDESAPRHGFGLEVLAGGQQLLSGAEMLRRTGLLGGLLVDGLGGAVGHDLGTLEAVETQAGAGYALADGGPRYAALGLETARRHFLADFTTEAGVSLISTLDRLRSQERHVYVWRVGVPGLIDGSARLRRGVEKDLETFVIEGAGKMLLKGWVVSPPEARVVLDDPLQVAVRADKADLWIAMAQVKGWEPTARRSGEGLNAVLELGSLRMSYDGRADRIVVTSAAARAEDRGTQRLATEQRDATGAEGRVR